MRTPVCRRIHATTREWLEAGDPADGRSIAPAFCFAAVADASPSLRSLLAALRSRALRLPAGFRSGACRAEAGFTRKVALFPAADRIEPALARLDALRSAQPLAHPVWNAALLHLSLLRLHSSAAGNGRPVRLLPARELWRAGLIRDSVLPPKRVLDATGRSRAGRTNPSGEYGRSPTRSCSWRGWSPSRRGLAHCGGARCRGARGRSGGEGHGQGVETRCSLGRDPVTRRPARGRGRRQRVVRSSFETTRSRWISELHTSAWCTWAR